MMIICIIYPYQNEIVHIEIILNFLCTKSIYGADYIDNHTTV